MNIRTTRDPVTLQEISDLEAHPCLYEGDGENGVEIYFENELTKQYYLGMELEDHKVVSGSDTDDYVAEG